MAAKRLLWGKVINLGQTCIAPDYVLCSKATEAKLVTEFRSLLKEWFGDRPKESKDMCRIVTDRHFERLLKLLKSTKGKVILGENYVGDLRVYPVSH